MNLPETFVTGNSVADTLLCADNEVMLPNSESGLQMSVHSLSQICKDLELQMSTLKIKVIAIYGPCLLYTSRCV